MVFKFKIILIFLIAIVFGVLNTMPQNLLYADQGANQQDAYLAFAEVMPEVEGGLSALYKSISYPEIAKRNGIQGKVYLMAFIDESGNVTDVKVIKGIGGGCDEASIEAVKNAKFKPGSNQGQPVKVKMSIPVNFKLN